MIGLALALALALAGGAAGVQMCTLEIKEPGTNRTVEAGPTRIVVAVAGPPSCVGSTRLTLRNREIDEGVRTLYLSEGGLAAERRRGGDARGSFVLVADITFGDWVVAAELELELEGSRPVLYTEIELFVRLLTREQRALRDDWDQVRRQLRAAAEVIPVWLDTALPSENQWGVFVPADEHNAPTPLSDVTLTDIVTYLSTQVAQQPPTYLEIGVSTGKSMFAVKSCRPGAMLAGLDIEDCNPVLCRQFDGAPPEPLDEWAVELERSGVFSRENGTLTRYSGSDGSVLLYAASYIADARAYTALRERLDGRRLNVILSDALHMGHAIRREYAQMTIESLIDYQDLAYVFDDLVLDGMLEAFQSICRDLRQRTSSLCCATFSTTGWLGDNVVGVITTLPRAVLTPIEFASATLSMAC